MAEKNWHPKFIEYMEMIKNHPNYQGLRIDRRHDGSLTWVAPKMGDTGKQRIEWALEKAKELGIKNEPGVFAKVMFELHPTKKKVCQVCGKEMSLYYIYLNSHLVDAFKKEFGDLYNFDTCTSIADAVDFIRNEYTEEKIIKFLIQKFKLPSEYKNKPLNKVLVKCEDVCRNGKCKLLGPGAMSNFPDRADGFHTYNRCCRSKEDKGRSKENLKSYTKDRRAYEYWSDGNIHAANQYMGSSFFKGTSADHIGPISLGFLHDPLFLRPMPPGDNSAKRDRLQYEDVEELIEIEKENNICAVSWYSEEIWNYIKSSYKQNRKNMDIYRDALKDSMNSFMNILWLIFKNGKEAGIEFCEEALLKPNLKYFDYDYEFGNKGKIIRKTKRNITDATKKEKDRYYRIAIDSVYQYHEKENRNIKCSLTNAEKENIYKLIYMLKYKDYVRLRQYLNKIVTEHQNFILKNLVKELGNN